MALTTNRIKTTNRSKMLLNVGTATIGATAGWTTANDNNLLSMAANQTAGTATIPINGVCIGDTITACRLLGGTAGAAAKTLAWGLWKTTKASGAITATLVQAMTSDTTATAHSIDIETYLTTPLKLADDCQYFFLLTGTTATGVTIDIIGIELDIKRTLGQES